MKLTLLHKGLLLVSIPLCFEITIFAVLINLQAKVEREAARMDVYNKINDKVNVILHDGAMVSDGLQLNSYEGLTAGLHKKELTEGIADMWLRFKELKELAHDDPAILSRVETCQLGMSLTRDDIRELKKKLKESSYMELPEIVKKARPQLDRHLNITFRGGLFGLAERSHQAIDDLPSERMRQQIQIILKCGLCLSALLYLIGAAMLSKNLVGRLTRLSDNASRLATRKPLLAPVGGSDEIAELDRNFHYAAALIEAANRMKQEVTAMITHDLKTPLQAIRSYLEMLDRGYFGQLSEQGIALRSTAYNSSEHMFGLIDSVLQLEKLRTGSIRLEAVPIELASVLDTCLESVRVLAKDKNTTLSGTYNQSGSVKVRGDAFWLEQVFVNILSNAIKFSPANSTVSVSTQTSVDGVEIGITDQGPGIPDKDIRLIFERFHRVQSTASVAGTGLGLPIAKELIELHHGSISVESAVGKGSTFTIKLPLSNDSDIVRDGRGASNSATSWDNGSLDDKFPSRAYDGDGEGDGNRDRDRPDKGLSKQPSAKRMRLTLLHKGLLLVSLPLCFELTIFGVLIHLQDQVDEVAKRINGRREFNHCQNVIMGDVIAIAESIHHYSWKGYVGSHRLDRYIEDVKRNLHEMEILAAGSATVLENVEVGKRGFEAISSELVASRQTIKNGTYEPADSSETKTKIGYEVNHILSDALLHLGTMTTDDVSSKRIREQFRILLQCALGLSVVVALTGAWVYSKHLVGRLSKLSDNARRLAIGEPLLAPVGGTDEVAELDRNFHYAAQLIEEANRMRQEVTAMITHDLKTPLQTIRSYLEMLENGLFGELNEQGISLLANAERACEHMVNLINNVLQLEKLRTGNVKLQAQPVELVPLLDKCLDTVESLAGEKEVLLNGSYSRSGLATVVGDAFWLEQVFTDMLANAIKFTKRNSTVAVSTSTANGDVEIRITDQGPGIPEKEKKLIFDRFHRVQSSQGIVGTGLGLPPAKELIELHHGSIELVSTAGNGSTFKIRLPLASDSRKN